MPSNLIDDKSRLPVVLTEVDKNYVKPERRNNLVDPIKYDSVETTVQTQVKLGTNGVGYVSANAMADLFQTSKAKAAYIYDNQVPDSDKRNFGDTSYAHSAAIVGLLDKKAQEVRDAEKQALLQYGRDSLINVTDSHQAQDLRRKCDAFTKKELPKLRAARGVTHDELSGDPLRPGAAFHHVNPKEIHTDPEDVLNPSKGRNLNTDSHHEVHKQNLNDEGQFENYKAKRNS